MKYLFILLLLTVASGRPDYNTPECNYCHDKFNVNVYEDERDECGSCHSMQPTTHEPKTCPVCHKVKDDVTYHITHTNISCESCHVGATKPPTTSCISCHPKPIHEIHNQCSDCHSTVSQKTNSKQFEKFTLLNLFQTILRQYVSIS
jgi:hypothetical protein